MNKRKGYPMNPNAGAYAKQKKVDEASSARKVASEKAAKEEGTGEAQRPVVTSVPSPKKTTTKKKS